MANRYYSHPFVLRRLYDGPLGTYIDGFGEVLFEQGYSAVIGQSKLGLASDLSLWLQRRRLTTHDLSEQRTDEFLRWTKRKRPGRYDLRYIGRSTMRQLLEYLRSVGAIAPPAAVPHNTPLDHVIDRYAQYLTLERGFTQVGLRHYLTITRRFLSERFGESPIRMSELRPTDISRFIVHAAKTGSAKGAQMASTALRSFCRFLHLRGEIATDLSVCVPTLPSWRLTGLPESLETEQVESLLKVHDQTTALGKRNYAILLLLARLGLRAGEVTNLTLDDINWEAGELTIRGKGGRLDRLPLPREVGNPDYSRSIGLN